MPLENRGSTKKGQLTELAFFMVPVKLPVKLAAFWWFHDSYLMVVQLPHGLSNVAT